MQADWILIDGNNLVYQAPPGMVGDAHADFPGARQRLARHLDGLGGHLAPRVTLVFDGTVAGRDDHFHGAAVDVIYCGPDSTADSVIERCVSSHRDADRILVVTSDRAEREAVTAQGGRTMSCATFIDLLHATRAQLTQALRARRQAGALRATLGDLFPRQTGS